MGFIEKIKSSVEMWRIEKYTKRRPVTSPDFEQKDREFYRQHYKDGVYLHQQPGAIQTTNSTNSGMINSISRKTTLLRTKSEKIMRSSENYNSNAR
ncbi:hypothetical protein INT47_008801 [Mucor saturninus]|uniref:Uncharacterized protein n=1 Tax=Mucor saturninus TaxID=64648 RepID=A0A8H7VEM9_9FUNG|nr:hypothetical protein INT47_008801 [Mucor saturninus]